MAYITSNNWFILAVKCRLTASSQVMSHFFPSKESVALNFVAANLDVGNNDDDDDDVQYQRLQQYSTIVQQHRNRSIILFYML